MLNLRTLVIDINFPGTILVHHMMFSVRGSILGPFICPSAHCSGHGSQSMQNPNFNWNQSNTFTGIVLQNLSLVFVKSCVLSSKNALDLASMTAGSRSILGGTDWDKAADALERAAEPKSYSWMLDDGYSCFNKCQNANAFWKDFFTLASIHFLTAFRVVPLRWGWYGCSFSTFISLPAALQCLVSLGPISPVGSTTEKRQKMPVIFVYNLASSKGSKKWKYVNGSTDR